MRSVLVAPVVIRSASDKFNDVMLVNMLRSAERCLYLAARRQRASPQQLLESRDVKLLIPNFWVMFTGSKFDEMPRL